MAEISGFNSLGDKNARILILGSMPSVTSLDRQQYYAHPRNVFWRIMAALFNEDNPLNYSQGQQLLRAEGIAVWDVLKSCVRQGSLDSDIERSSIEVNDFISFFKKYRHIRTVFFNGSAAESMFTKSVYPLLPIEYKSIYYSKLPSTSPAYAAMSYEDKLVAWAALKTRRGGERIKSTLFRAR